MGFFKDLKNRARGLRSQVQPPMSPRPTSMGNKFDRMFGMSRQSPRPIKRGGFRKFFPEPPRQAPMPMPGDGIRLPDYIRYEEGEPINTEPNLLRRFRSSPQIMPERRMPSRGPTPRFFGGGLKSIFAGLPQTMDRFEDQSVGQGMSPPLPRAPLPMPQDMPRERFPMMRPGFAEGEEIDIRKIFAEQAAREGMSPPEVATQKLKQFLGETGRTVSNRDAELYGVGVLTLEDIIDRATDLNVQEIIGDSGRTISDMDRNLLQQEQMFFPDSGRTISNMDMNSLDDMLADLEKKN